VTVWASREPTDAGHTKFSLEVAHNPLPFFKEYFDTAVPIPPKTGKSRELIFKDRRSSLNLDLLSIPDFVSGAMENCGLVSFREDRIIFDEKIASTYQKHRLAETMAHELAHFCRYFI